MKINVHVERLILEGFSVDARYSALIQAAVEAELGGRLTRRGLRKDLQTVGQSGPTSGIGASLDSIADSKTLGARIGLEVYNAISGIEQQGGSHC